MRKHLILVLGLIFLMLVSAGTGLAQGFKETICDFTLDIAEKPTDPPSYTPGETSFIGTTNWKNEHGKFAVKCYGTMGSKKLAVDALERQDFIDAELAPYKKDPKFKLSPVKKAVAGKKYSYIYKGVTSRGVYRGRFFFYGNRFISLQINSPTDADAAAFEKWADTLKILAPGALSASK